jgi:hypothetical protein
MGCLDIVNLPPNYPIKTPLGIPEEHGESIDYWIHSSCSKTPKPSYFSPSCLFLSCSGFHPSDLNPNIWCPSWVSSSRCQFSQYNGGVPHPATSIVASSSHIGACMIWPTRSWGLARGSLKGRRCSRAGASQSLAGDWEASSGIEVGASVWSSIQATHP